MDIFDWTFFRCLPAAPFFFFLLSSVFFVFDGMATSFRVAKDTIEFQLFSRVMLTGPVGARKGPIDPEERPAGRSQGGEFLCGLFEKFLLLEGKEERGTQSPERGRIADFI